MLNNINDLLLVAKQQEGGYEPYYEVLEYIQFSGDEYFDTGVLGNSNTKIEAGIALASTSTDWLYLFGARGNSNTVSASTNNIDCVYGGISSGGTISTGLVCDFNNSNYTTYRLNVDKANLAINTFYDIVINKDKRQILQDGTSKGSNTTVCSDTFNSVNTITIGKVNGTNLQNYGYFNGRLKYFKIDNMDLIPALDSQMRPCLYDKISKTFTYAKKLSDGTDATDTLTFKRWNKFDVDYIESSDTQYINTGYKPTKNTSFDLYGIDMDYTSATTRFGSRTGTYSETFVLATIADSHFRWSYGTGTAPATTDNVFSTEKTAKQISWNATTKKCTITFTDGTTEDSVQMKGTDLTSNAVPVYLFAFNSNGEAICGTVKHTRIVFREGDIIVRDYKPVVWHNGDSTAEACLYDEVYNKMYPNLGTGSFKAYITNDTNYTLMSYTYMNTHGYYISATGVVTAQAESDYTDAIAVEQGDIVTLTISTTSRVSNKRIHGYSGTSTSDWVSQLGVIEYAQTGGDTRTLSIVVPSGVTYIRISHSIYGETQCDLTITRTYEVGKSVSGTPSSSVLGVSNCFDTALYGTQDTTVKYFAIGYDSNSTAGQLFGSYDGNTDTSNNLTINSTGTGNTAPIRFDGQVITTAIKIPINTFASIITSKYGLWVNDSLHGTWGDVNDFTTTTTMLILKCNNSTNTRNNGCGYCLILEKDIPTAEFIPVRNANNTSVYGLYDKVSKTLNTGEGTINFNVLD